MIEAYEKTTYMKPAIHYDRGIIDITRQCDVFHIAREFGRSEDVGYRAAIYALTGIYYHFLVSGGRIRKGLSVASDPGRICLNITVNELPDGKPVMTLQETAECLGHILHGLYCFHGRRCRAYGVAQGMGFLVRKIYEPYKNSGDRGIHDIYYALIARGSFVLQMNNEIMARAFYKGLYGAWTLASEEQRYFFGGMSLDARACFDDLLSRKDVAVDPMHEWRLYPWNMYCYNVDNLILTYTAALEYIDAAERLHFASEKELAAFKQTKGFIRDFFTRISPFYMTRCDYYNNRQNEYIKEDKDPVEYYGNVRHTMEAYDTLSMDYAPYLFYSCELFRSTEDKTTWLYEGIAKCYTGRNCAKLDNVSPLFGQRISKLARRLQTAENAMIPFGTATIGVFSMHLLVLICEWETRTGLIRKTVIGFVIFFIIGCFGSASNDSK